MASFVFIQFWLCIHVCSVKYRYEFADGGIHDNRKITHPNDNANDTVKSHESTQCPRTENMSEGTCISRTTGLRGSSI